MKAIILAAGYATRLYPLTKDFPKALLNVKGKPIINYILDEILTIDAVDNIFVVTNDKFYDHFSQWATGLTCNVPVRVLNDKTRGEDERLGAIGDIQFVIESVQLDDDCIIIAGDNYFTFKLMHYYAEFLKRNCDMVCVKELDDREALKHMGVALLDENAKVIDLEEKPDNPKSNKAVYATYMYTRDTMKLFKTYLDSGHKKDAPGNFVAWLHKLKDVYAYIMDGDCIDIGTIECYNQVNEIQ